MDIQKNARKWFSVFVTAIMYFVVHEGAHAIYAMCIGTFEKINFMAFGVQVQINRELMTDLQFGIFNLVGSIATLICGYICFTFISKIVKVKSKVFKAIMYYMTLGFMIVDPLYLLILYKFVGGGDMNGITFILPQIAVKITAGVFLVVNLYLILKKIIPAYKKAFQE